MGASGDTSGATLRVTRPGTMPDDAAATYLIQAYSDADGTVKVGGCNKPLGGCDWQAVAAPQLSAPA